MKNPLLIDPRERRAMLDSQYARLSKVSDLVPYVDEFSDLIENMLALGDNGSKKDKWSHYSQKASIIEQKLAEAQEQINRAKDLAHEMRLMRGTIRGYRTNDMLDFSNMTDDEIDAVEPTKEVKTFSMILATFPEIYYNFMERLNITRQEYQNGLIHGSSFIERDKIRIKKGLTPIEPSTAPVNYSVRDENENLKCMTHSAKIIADVMNLVAKTRGELLKGNEIVMDEKTLLLILRVIKNPDCQDYYSEEVMLARKTLEILKFSDKEILELFKYLKNKWCDFFSGPILHNYTDDKKVTSEPHVILEEVYANNRQEEATMYKERLTEIIVSLKKGGARNWGVWNFINAFFSERSTIVLDAYYENFLTDKQKKDIINEVLMETGFSREDGAKLIRKCI